MWNDLVYSGRQAMRRWPATLSIVLLIGVGVACGTALFAVIDGLLLKPLPFGGSEHLVGVSVRDDRIAAGVRSSFALREVEALRALGVIDAAYYTAPGPATTVQGDGLRLARVSGEFFDVLRVQAQLGRLLTSDDSGAESIVLSDSTWRTRYGGSPTILGQRIVRDDASYTVVGVAPQRVDFPWGAHAWVVEGPRPEWTRGAFLLVVGRVPDGQSIAAAAARLPMNVLVPLRERIAPGGTFGLVMLLVGACLVLGVTWVQVASLQFARAVERGHELRIRMALGAGRLHIVRAAAADGIWLSAGAFAIAAALTAPLTRLIVSQLPTRMTIGQAIHIDLRVMAFALATSAVGVLTFAIGPAWRRERRGDLSALRGTADRVAFVRTRNWLVVAQVAVAVPLIYVAGLAWLSATRLAEHDLGFTPGGLFTVRVPSAPASLPAGDFAAANARVRAGLDALAGVPGVTHAAAAGDVPYSGMTTGLLVVGDGGDAAMLPAQQTLVDGDYFAAMRIPVTAGRTLAEGLSRDGAGEIVVNETVAAYLRAQGRDIGAQVVVTGHPARVVGVVGDVRDTEHPTALPRPRVYVSPEQWGPPGYLLVRLDPAHAESEARVRTRLAQLWPGARLDLEPVADRVDAVAIDYRGRATLMGILAATAIALTLLGLYGAVASATRDRSAEIAVRIICGADPKVIGQRVVTGTLRWVALGIAAGLAAGWAAARAISSLLFSTDALDPVVLLSVVGLLLSTATLSALHPAIRAARIQPAAALRDL